MTERVPPGGRRRPWLLAGIATGAAGSVIIAVVPSLGALIAGWTVAYIGYTITAIMILAFFGDQLPENQRGRVMGLNGSITYIGPIMGILVATQLHESPRCHVPRPRRPRADRRPRLRPRDARRGRHHSEGRRPDERDLQRVLVQPAEVLEPRVGVAQQGARLPLPRIHEHLLRVPAHVAPRIGRGSSRRSG
ncbi:MFS transporter [Curtobacterium sp. MCJR17_043]|uniref:MFS transporter n=1 Tax=Curtobacterium sp. MCJR17_043 TaxID=2175660 RepID=UPI0032E935E9